LIEILALQDYSNDMKIAIIGLGYVGLPLAVEFGKKFDTIGFDINEERVKQIREYVDATEELSKEELIAATKLIVTTSLDDVAGQDFYIVTVPTPVDEYHQPDLKPLIAATSSVGKVIGSGAYVIFESTVFPGCTEDICVPILEKESGLKFNKDFFCGYSPERINPGDKQHGVTTIKKVTSGSTPEAAKKIDILYQTIIKAGTHLASSIKVAEAAKVIENAQRDINIAFVNELSLIFNRLNIDTLEVLEAAGTKWNFLPFKPGLVGGHCIGVDPYYLTQKAESVGYHPEVILSGRRINDNMGNYIGQRVIKLISQSGKVIKGSRVLLLGFTFKENCPDIRNTKVIDIYNELLSFGAHVSVHDPRANPEEVQAEYKLRLYHELPSGDWDAIVVAVAHEEFDSLEWEEFHAKGTVIYDVKGVVEKSLVSERL
jgi:UDP-N-acetyl-D-galactosamine dehydrogenase